MPRWRTATWFSFCLLVLHVVAGDPPSRKIHFSDVERAIAEGPCPLLSSLVHVTLLLGNAPGRVKMFHRNQALLKPFGITSTRIPAVDGLNHSVALHSWRELGVRFVSNSRYSPKSFGAFSCTLSHIRALRWQVQNRVPLAMVFEDDVRILNVTRFLAMVCIGMRHLQNNLKLPIVEFGSASSTMLTSLRGAKLLLQYYCDNGIQDNVDFVLKHNLTMFLLQSMYLRAFTVHQPGAGYIAKTGHELRPMQLRNESALWAEDSTARSFCHDGSLDTDGFELDVAALTNTSRRAALRPWSLPRHQSSERL